MTVFNLKLTSSTITPFQSFHGNETPKVLKAKGQLITSDLSGCLNEHLILFNLVNMNGRLYDPLGRRFFNVDLYVQMPDYTQNVNRYSYCLNNPLKFNDPSGEFISLLIVAVAAVMSGGVNVAVHWKEIKAAGGGWNTFWKGPDILGLEQ